MTTLEKQPTLFDDAPETDPADLDTAQQEIGDLLDHWQRLLGPEDWATVAEAVMSFCRVTTMEEKPKKPTNRKGNT